MIHAMHAFQVVLHQMQIIVKPGTPTGGCVHEISFPFMLMHVHVYVYEHMCV